jgi:hypothetical protein
VLWTLTTEAWGFPYRTIIPWLSLNSIIVHVVYNKVCIGPRYSAPVIVSEVIYPATTYSRGSNPRRDEPS